MKRLWRGLSALLNKDAPIGTVLAYVMIAGACFLWYWVVVRPVIFINNFFLGFRGSDDERFWGGLILVFIVALVLWGLLWTYHRIFGKSPKP